MWHCTRTDTLIPKSHVNIPDSWGRERSDARGRWWREKRTSTTNEERRYNWDRQRWECQRLGIELSSVERWEGNHWLQSFLACPAFLSLPHLFISSFSQASLFLVIKTPDPLFLHPLSLLFFFSIFDSLSSWMVRTKEIQRERRRHKSKKDNEERPLSSNEGKMRVGWIRNERN